MARSPISPPDTRQRLLFTALRLFAEGGVGAVSTRAIQTAAGSQNASAIQYHFGNKTGLVEAVVNLVGERLGEAASELPDPEAAFGDTRQLARELLTPFIGLYLDPEIGRDAIRFLSRLQMEPDPELRPIFRRHLGEHARRIEEIVQRALPSLPPETVRLRLLFTFALVVHGFATMERLRDSSLGEMEPPAAERLLKEFTDYVAGAWDAPVSG
jgi:AcrR family transcriptional regulator